jgi:hypothetical protein
MAAGSAGEETELCRIEQRACGIEQRACGIEQRVREKEKKVGRRVKSGRRKSAEASERDNPAGHDPQTQQKEVTSWPQQTGSSADSLAA